MLEKNIKKLDGLYPYKGSLVEIQMKNFLRFLHENGKTGTVSIYNKNFPEIYIHIWDGEIVSITTNNELLWILRLLFRNKHISADETKRIILEKKHNISTLEEYMLSKNFITQELWSELTNHRLVDIAKCSIFLKKGGYYFEETEAIFADNLNLNLNTKSIISEIEKIPATAIHLFHELEEEDHIYCPKHISKNSYKLTSNQEWLFSQFDGDYSIKNIILISPVEYFSTIQDLSYLLRLDLVSRVAIIQNNAINNFNIENVIIDSLNIKPSSLEKITTKSINNQIQQNHSNLQTQEQQSHLKNRFNNENNITNIDKINTDKIYASKVPINKPYNEKTNHENIQHSRQQSYQASHQMSASSLHGRFQSSQSKFNHNTYSINKVTSKDSLDISNKNLANNFDNNKEELPIFQHAKNLNNKEVEDNKLKDSFINSESKDIYLEDDYDDGITGEIIISRLFSNNDTSNNDAVVDASDDLEIEITDKINNKQNSKIPDFSPTDPIRKITQIEKEKIEDLILNSNKTVKQKKDIEAKINKNDAGVFLSSQSVLDHIDLSHIKHYGISTDIPLDGIVETTGEEDEYLTYTNQYTEIDLLLDTIPNQGVDGVNKEIENYEMLLTPSMADLYSLTDVVKLAPKLEKKQYPLKTDGNITFKTSSLGEHEFIDILLDDDNSSFAENDITEEIEIAEGPLIVTNNTNQINNSKDDIICSPFEAIEHKNSNHGYNKIDVNINNNNEECELLSAHYVATSVSALYHGKDMIADVTTDKIKPERPTDNIAILDTKTSNTSDVRIIYSGESPLDDDIEEMIEGEIEFDAQDSQDVVIQQDETLILSDVIAEDSNVKVGYEYYNNIVCYNKILSSAFSILKKKHGQNNAIDRYKELISASTNEFIEVLNPSYVQNDGSIDANSLLAASKNLYDSKTELIVRHIMESIIVYIIMEVIYQCEPKEQIDLLNKINSYR